MRTPAAKTLLSACGIIVTLLFWVVLQLVLGTSEQDVLRSPLTIFGLVALVLTLILGLKRAKDSVE